PDARWRGGMSPYTVEWPPAAADELTRIWLQTSNRPAVTAAQAQGDRLLARDPHGNRRLLSADLYQIDNSPLAISSTIEDAHSRGSCESAYARAAICDRALSSVAPGRYIACGGWVADTLTNSRTRSRAGTPSSQSSAARTWFAVESRAVTPRAGDQTLSSKNPG